MPRMQYRVQVAETIHGVTEWWDVGGLPGETGWTHASATVWAHKDFARDYGHGPGKVLLGPGQFPRARFFSLDMRHVRR